MFAERERKMEVFPTALNRFLRHTWYILYALKQKCYFEALIPIYWLAWAGNVAVVLRSRRITWNTAAACCTIITGVHSNQDQIWCVKIGEYTVFYVDGRS